MATRSLTEVYILMRNNALQNRHIFADQSADDRMALVSSTDVELGMMSKNKLPPEWIDGVEEVQFEITRIKQKSKDLSVLHDKHINKPTLDDSMDEEHAIEIQTQDITQMFHRCQRLVQQISRRSSYGNAQDVRLTQNITSSLARTLQELSTNFRKGQSAYLRRLRCREERSKQYFGNDININDGFVQVDELDEVFDRGFTSGQMQSVDNNSVMVQQRDKEVAQIVKSIQDLNEIFKDLATMIVDQGTILDRIDYNIENTSVRVEKGLQHLNKASKYQKKSRKMYIIVVLAIVTILLMLILIAVKSR